MKRLALLSAVLATLTVVVIAGLAGCGKSGDDKDGGLGPGPTNLRPGVERADIPFEGDTTRYIVEFHWSAWDPDGEVDHYVYCVDPPTSAGVDTLWEMTEVDSVELMFTAEAYDTTTIDEWSDWEQCQIGVGYHVFVIKAVDDLGAMSAPDYVAFKTSTVCPRAYISSPSPAGGWNAFQGAAQRVGLRVTFRWWGEDPDGIFTDRPVRYLYKLKDVTGVQLWKSVAARLYEEPGLWAEIGPGTTAVTLDLNDNRDYGFGLKAVDEAGAVEPLLVLNRNLLWVGARGTCNFPNLEVNSAAFGTRRWSGWTADTEMYEVPLGGTYEFYISGDASWYGGIITGYSFGWDLPDLDDPSVDPDGKGAWTPWSTTRTTITAQFPEARDYYLYIKCKDNFDCVTLATIHFDVAVVRQR